MLLQRASIMFVINMSDNYGWPKSNVLKVRPYCSASDHPIRKICLGVCWDSHWSEEYLKISEMDDKFFRMNVHFSCFSHIMDMSIILI